MAYNVVNEYDWTSAPKGSSIRREIPTVWLKSYKINSNQIMTMINGYLNIAKNSINGTAEDFYNNMYANSTDAEDDFFFPFFSDTVRSFTNTFGDTFQDGIGGGGGIGESLKNSANTYVGLGAQIAGFSDPTSMATAASQIGSGDFTGAAKTIGKGGSPGSYVETPMFYQFEKNDGPLEISFTLSNTLNPEAVEKNHALVKKLTEINRPLRRNSIAVDPPRIFRVQVYGQRFMRWAYCSSFSVQLLGYRRQINNVIHPEAYQITMSMQSLTLEHAGFINEQ
jgi:hypothetical protein